MGYFFESFPPGKSDLKTCSTVLKNMVRGHAAAYRTIHSLQPDASVGIALNYQSFQPAHTWLPLDHWLARFMHNNFNAAFSNALRTGSFKFAFQTEAIPEAKATQDYFGLNYYTRTLVSLDLTNKKENFIKMAFPKNARVSGTGHMANVPDGFLRSHQIRPQLWIAHLYHRERHRRSRTTTCGRKTWSTHPRFGGL